MGRRAPAEKEKKKTRMDCGPAAALDIDAVSQRREFLPRAHRSFFLFSTRQEKKAVQKAIDAFVVIDPPVNLSQHSMMHFPATGGGRRSAQKS